MIRRKIIRLLLKLITPSVRIEEVDHEKINNWLVMQADDQRILEYLKMRSVALLKVAGAGIDREQYIEMIGRRLEVLTLLQKVEDAKKTVAANRAKRERDDRKRKEEQLNNK